jgi:2-oxoglutarate dehydrogenase E2 component (dihydrolipoamide succinyltransferase)
LKIKVPVLPESVSDATIATWHKKPGDAVKRDENLVDLETDKVVLEVPAHGRRRAEGDPQCRGRRHGDQRRSCSASSIEGEAASTASAAKAESACTGQARRLPTRRHAAAAAKLPSNELSPAGRRVATEQNIDPSQRDRQPVATDA